MKNVRPIVSNHLLLDLRSGVPLFADRGRLFQFQRNAHFGDHSPYEYLSNKETEEIEKKNIAEFNQYPIRLSYAMTIHKSQGKTFEKIVVDVGNGAFAHGQVYVALSRSKTLEGIFLNNPIRDRDIIVDQRVIDFHKKGNSDCA